MLVKDFSPLFLLLLLLFNKRKKSHKEEKKETMFFYQHRFIFLFFSLHFPALSFCISTKSLESSDPVPAVWPEQFHSILFMNNSKGTLQIIDLWYDWPNGRNFNIIQDQLGKKLYDLEWDNGTSFFYTLDSNEECRVKHIEVGILRPNWLDGATYLGQKYKDGFLCNVWEKVDFIWYYEDVETKRPVYWRFFTGRNAHVMTFEVGNVLEDPNWQAPVYCFGEDKGQSTPITEELDSPLSSGDYVRGFGNVAMSLFV